MLCVDLALTTLQDNQISSTIVTVHIISPKLKLAPVKTGVRGNQWSIGTAKRRKEISLSRNERSTTEKEFKGPRNQFKKKKLPLKKENHSHGATIHRNIQVPSIHRVCSYVILCCKQIMKVCLHMHIFVANIS